MSEYWKSTAKKYCTICKMWYADNKISVQNHELGVKHKAMIQQRLRESTKKAQENDRKNAELQHTLIQMEQAALASLTQDDKKRIAQEPSKLKQPPPRLPSKLELQRREFRQQKQKLKELKRTGRRSQFWGNDDNNDDQVNGYERFEKEWVQAFLETGEPYYWHFITGETSWNQPSSFYTAEEYTAKFNELILQASTSYTPNYNYPLKIENSIENPKKKVKKINENLNDIKPKKRKEINDIINETKKNEAQKRIDINLDDDLLRRPTEIKIDFNEENLNENNNKKLELIKNEQPITNLINNIDEKINEDASLPPSIQSSQPSSPPAAAPAPAPAPAPVSLLGPWIPVIPKKKETLIINDLPAEASIIKTQSELVEEMQLEENEFNFKQKILPETRKKSSKIIEFKKRSFTNKENLRTTKK